MSSVVEVVGGSEDVSSGMHMRQWYMGEFVGAKAGVWGILCVLVILACINYSAGSISSTNRAFADHNNIMVAKMMMKYGIGEAKASAREILRKFGGRGRRTKKRK